MIIAVSARLANRYRSGAARNSALVPAAIAVLEVDHIGLGGLVVAVYFGY
jgi:hypothetical protein